MSKFQELQRELKNADQAKVSTAQLKQRLNDIIARTADASTRENLISELMNSKEFKDVHYLTNLRIVPEERKKEFRPRQYDTRKLTTKSDPRLLVNMVNNLRQAMQRRGTSTAPIGRFGGDFFANILKRGEG